MFIFSGFQGHLKALNELVGEADENADNLKAALTTRSQSENRAALARQIK